MKIKPYIFLIIVIFNTTLSSVVYSQCRQPLKKKWNLVSRKLEFAKELQISFHDQSTGELLSTAEFKLRRARNLIQARRPLLANRFIKDAENLINQAMRHLLGEPVRDRSEKLARKIQQAKKIVSKSNIQQAYDLLDKGVQNKSIAEQSFKAGEFQKALKHFRQAEFQVQKSIDIVKNRDNSTKQQAREEAQRFDQLVAQAKVVISRSTNQTVQKNYRSAIKLSQDAERAKSEGNFRLAIDFYHKATRLLLRAIDLAEGKTDRSASRAYEEVASLEELIENIRQRVKPFEDNERIQFFMSHIEQLQEDAQKALEAQDYNLVLLNTQYARNLIERVHNKLRGQTNETSELIAQELSQLEVDLNDINDRLVTNGTNEQARILLTYAKLAKTKAEELLKQQKYRFARESTLEANRFAFAADRLIRKQNIKEISSDLILNKIQAIENDISLFQSKITEFTRPDARVYYDYAQKMLALARENLNRSYLYAAEECIAASKSALEKLRTIFR
ncbi:MAG: hypothetical protein JSW07_20855 [bacterium]|nr:MAG: hypothetical protein JSW07_20855 [bacterium]